jgi:ABC-type spermidine/putrescine transport system permease subunit I
VLLLLAAMMRIDRNLLPAAETMGHPRRRCSAPCSYRSLTLPACAAGALLIFILTFGFYVTPALLGVSRVTMVANLLHLLIDQMPDWELASAIAIVLLALIIMVQAFASGLRRWTQRTYASVALLAIVFLVIPVLMVVPLSVSIANTLTFPPPGLS